MSESAGKPAPEEAARGECTERSLREAELQETELIRKMLYTSPLDEESTDATKEETTHDTVRLSREARDEFVKAAMRPMKEKVAEFRGFVELLGRPQNGRVVGVFLITTAVMFTIPIIVLLIGMHLVAPAIGADAGVCGGFMALGSTVIIMASYVIYAFVEPGAGAVEGRPAGDKKNQ
ncbi:hypothetical protein DQ04_02691060 [Trypanosoma grayi]|uniref:hypothetical protein n=1 Tax=Trypanosoma grayi TaxID=71804 RepID=UPI0004F4B9C7|nr:hypothetical protein DQ04_02691060 [Trypanosoma grayi]KEG11373.1 hypothetical protein DQ04_02691060 [Trypanosoma grayi]